MKLFLLITAAFAGGLAISLNQGGYEDVYIVIQDSVPENDELIRRIKVTYFYMYLFKYNIIIIYLSCNNQSQSRFIDHW